MLLNYLKLTIRLLGRNPFLTFINVLGLSVGFAAFYILWPYAHAELNSDRFHQNYENMARLSWHHRWTDNNRDWDEFYHASIFCGIGKHIADEFSEVEDFTRVVAQQNFRKTLNGFDSKVFFTVYRNDSTKDFFREENVAYVDPNFFTFFTFTLHAGDRETLLSEPFSAALSETISHKYFGDANPVNAIIYLNDSIPYKVTGVFEDLPRTTHLKSEILITTAGIADIDLYKNGYTASSWIGANYIKVKNGVSFEELQSKIDSRRKEFFGVWDNSDPTVFVQPLKAVVFSNLVDNPFNYKSKNALLILRSLSFVILFLAWTNYIALSVTALHKRLPEVGTRKVVGAAYKDFAFQFFTESLIINGFSLLLALTIVQLVKSPAAYFFHFYIADWNILFKQNLTMLLFAPVSGVIITALYPVSISTRKAPAILLKKLRAIRLPWWIDSLVTLQYISAIVLLAWIVTVYYQLDFILNKSTGITQDGAFVMDCPLDRGQDTNSRLDNFIDESLKINGIYNASLSKSVMGDATGRPLFVKRTENSASIGLFSNGVVDENFIGLYGIRLVEGRNFQSDMPSDRKAVLISKIASKRLGFSTPKECIGARIILPRYNSHDVEIIGVYDDYEFEPFFKENQAKGNGSILTYKTYLTPDVTPLKISFKLGLLPGNPSIAEIERLYKSIFPNETFKGTFLDQNIHRHYAQERIARNQIMLFTLLAIGVACLGLLGITSNKLVEKTKEIGIRKVLGARMHQIAHILLNTTAKQMIIAVVVGLPIAYYLIHQYLEKYSDKISVHWWHYAIPVCMLIIIMFSTIASILLKAARTNPTESLRYE